MKKIKSVDCDYVELVGTLEASTPKAILFNNGPKEVWLPRSQIEDMELSSEDHRTITIAIPEWLALKKELI